MILWSWSMFRLYLCLLILPNLFHENLRSWIQTREKSRFQYGSHWKSPRSGAVSSLPSSSPNKENTTIIKVPKKYPWKHVALSLNLSLNNFIKKSLELLIIIINIHPFGNSRMPFKKLWKEDKFFAIFPSYWRLLSFSPGFSFSTLSRIY